MLSVWVPCFSFSCPVTQARASSTILSKSGKSEHFCLISYLKGKAFSLSFIEFDIVAQSFSCAQLFATPWTAAHQASLSFTISQNLLKLMSESVMPSNHLILCRPLLLLTSIFLSIRVFSNESVLRIRWPKYWIFSFSISPSNEYSGLISFGMLKECDVSCGFFINALD